MAQMHEGAICAPRRGADLEPGSSGYVDQALSIAAEHDHHIGHPLARAFELDRMRTLPVAGTPRDLPAIEVSLVESALTHISPKEQIHAEP